MGRAKRLRKERAKRRKEKTFSKLIDLAERFKEESTQMLDALRSLRIEITVESPERRAEQEAFFKRCMTCRAPIVRGEGNLRLAHGTECPKCAGKRMRDN